MGYKRPACGCGCGNWPCPRGTFCIAGLKKVRNPLGFRCVPVEALGRLHARRWWSHWVAQWDQSQKTSSGLMDLREYVRRTGDDLSWLR